MAEARLSPISHLQAALAQIDHAGEQHERWSEDVLRAVACRQPGDPRNLADDAHRRCAFGYWYDELASEAVRSNDGFAALGEAHERMHRAAAALLRAVGADQPVTPVRFDEFAAGVKLFRLHLATLRREFEQAVSGVDPLTGAGNRMAMLPHLRRQLALAQRGVAACVIAMMDLDRFKTVNDTHGHAAGDKVLAAVAGHILRNLRPYDRLFRYGGEEFLLCAVDADLATARALAERLREGVAGLAIDAGVGAPVRITISIGVAAMDPSESVEQAIDRADKALYEAKAAGRDRTVVSGASS